MSSRSLTVSCDRRRVPIFRGVGLVVPVVPTLTSVTRTNGDPRLVIPPIRDLSVVSVTWFYFRFGQITLNIDNDRVFQIRPFPRCLGTLYTFCSRRVKTFNLSFSISILSRDRNITVLVVVVVFQTENSRLVPRATSGLHPDDNTDLTHLPVPNPTRFWNNWPCRLPYLTNHIPCGLLFDVDILHFVLTV